MLIFSSVLDNGELKLLIRHVNIERYPYHKEDRKDDEYSKLCIMHFDHTNISCGTFTYKRNYFSLTRTCATMIFCAPGGLNPNELTEDLESLCSE